MHGLMRQQRGNVLVFTALTLPLVVGLAAFVVDIGLVAMTKRGLQNAADAAVLAGAQELPGAASLALEEAIDYAWRNGVRAEDTVAPTVRSTFAVQDTLFVRLQRRVPLVFARLWGPQNLEVTAEAEAVVGRLGAQSGVVPWAVQNPRDVPGCNPQLQLCFPFGGTALLKLQPGDQVMGNFQALALDGSGAATYRTTLVNGSRATVTAGSWVPTETGNMAGPTRQGLEERIAADTHSFWEVVRPPQGGDTYTLLEPLCPRLVVVPIIRELANPSQDVLVLGLALFFVETYGTAGRDAEVSGRFIKSSLRQGQWAPLTSDFGTRLVRLWQ